MLWSNAAEKCIVKLGGSANIIGRENKNEKRTNKVV